MSDKPSTEMAPPKRIGLTTAVDNCPYDTHVGPEALEPMLNQNLTGFRPRGYGVGNLYQKWREPELFYKQVRIAIYVALHVCNSKARTGLRLQCSVTGSSNCAASAQVLAFMQS
jgi:hypothetical protein